MTLTCIRKTNKKKKSYNWKRAKNHWQMYLILLIPIIHTFIFKYIPMYGIQIAFKDFYPKLGYFNSPWVGAKYFKTFFSSFYFNRLLFNTIILSFYGIIAGFFPPIILAVMLNECKSKAYKKTVQMVTYAPYFISTVLIVSILTQVFSLQGTVNNIIELFGGKRIQFLGQANLFRHFYVWSGIWQGTGYSAIIYLAALAGINPELYEAAKVDGCSIWQRIWNIDIPSIMPTAVILLILASAGILNVGMEKTLLLQNPLNMQKAEIISTFTYKTGLRNMDYSYATAVGLFQSVVSILLMTTVNTFARKASETSLW